MRSIGLSVVPSGLTRGCAALHPAGPGHICQHLPAGRQGSQGMAGRPPPYQRQGDYQNAPLQQQQPPQQMPPPLSQVQPYGQPGPQQMPYGNPYQDQRWSQPPPQPSRPSASYTGQQGDRQPAPPPEWGATANAAQYQGAPYGVPNSPMRGQGLAQLGGRDGTAAGQQAADDKKALYRSEP